jgi:tetratricopeptide (TPR) repeat protein
MTLVFWSFWNGAAAARRHLRTGIAALALVAFALVAAPVRADDLQDANALLKKGQHAQALDKINQYLSSRPRDAQGRFLKGLILTEQNKSAEAIDVFTKLTQDYPELPEPYNNLAVLYAAQGQYEKARQSLEMSIRTHPSYATAYENLGDVYTKLASQAYDKALQLDSSNSAAQTKLSLVRDLITGGTGNTRPTKPAATKPEPQKPVAVAAAPKAEPAAATAKPADTKAEPAAKPAAKPAAPGSEEVVSVVRAWARAWAAKDVKAYLAHYARDFKTPGGESRADWEKGRAQRINAPKEIEVGIDSPRVTISGDTATVNYRQTYRSDKLKVSSNKTLVLARNNGKWLIQQERSGS